MAPVILSERDGLNWRMGYWAGHQPQDRQSARPRRAADAARARRRGDRV